jgi:DNA-binding NarL/FixJ family response regulator
MRQVWRRVGFLPVVRVSVLIADDNPLFAEAVAALLETDARVQVVGCAANGAEAVDFAHKLAPDLVLMDLRMPVMDGVEATGRITERSPHVKVLAITAHDSPEEVEAALGAGAAGCVAKDDLGLRLVDTVLGVAEPSPSEPAARFFALGLP